MVSVLDLSEYGDCMSSEGSTAVDLFKSTEAQIGHAVKWAETGGGEAYPDFLITHGEGFSVAFTGRR